MAAPRPKLATYLLPLLVWSALFGWLHYVYFRPYIGSLVLPASEQLVALLSQAQVRLGALPGDGIFASKGFWLATPEMAQPFRYPHNLYSVTLNFMFAPALVLATYGTMITASAWLRATLAMLIMLILHIVHVSTLALYFPLTQAPIPNPLIGEDFPTWLSAFIRWNYTFTDKMAYTLFPFVAWFCVCFGRVITLFQRYAGNGSGIQKEDGAEKRT